MSPFQTLATLLSLGLCPGEPVEQRVDPPVVRPVNPANAARLRETLDLFDSVERKIATQMAKQARFEREQKALGDARERKCARCEYELWATSVVGFNASLNGVVRARTGLRLPSIKYWQLVPPRADDPSLPQSIKDDNFLSDYLQLKHVLSDIKFEVSIEYWEWTGKWLPTPAFLESGLRGLPGR